DKPGNVVWRPSDRDRAWLKLYDAHKGKIDADFGKLAFTMPPLAKASSLDAKFTTTDLAKKLKSLALWGPPLGRTWLPNDSEKDLYADIRPLVSHPWTVLHTTAPEKEAKPVEVADLHDPAKSNSLGGKSDPDDEDLPTKPAWHGTLLP